MRIRWDAALTAATARALDARFFRARVRAVHLDPVARRAVVYLREATLVWELHPERLGLHILEAEEPPPEARRLPAQLKRVEAPADERIMRLEMRRVRGQPSTSALVLELIPNQENALFLEGDDDTIRALLRTREGDRPLRRGQPWTMPETSARAGAVEPVPREMWGEALAGLEGREARSALLRSFAWTSPAVADWLLVDGVEAGYERWMTLRERALGDPGPAAVLTDKRGLLPYPVALPGQTVEEVADLLEAFRVVGERGESEPRALIPGAVLDALAREADRARGRMASLEKELGGLVDPDEVQGWGDLLLARFHLVPSGEESVELEGFTGEAVTIPLDPTLTPDENARRHYDRAGKIRRAREELPARVARARERWEALEELLERARRGEAPREEVEAVIPDTPKPGSSGARGQQAPTLPYRVYRSSGGLEIRVGRGSARNDDLTFRHSRPDDIWLHARHTAGAHVILRWPEEGAPPARDLEEAAILAALNSKARTSGSVPVDWTRRKYVRKPRKAPPGAVLPDRVQTLFVAPDEAVAEALREE
jgi:predicted ribosome quality control (RQC) complex YloA/Tae2 family protein